MLQHLCVGASGATPAEWDLRTPPAVAARFTARITLITPKTSELLSFVLIVTNTGGATAKPSCRVTLTGPGTRWEFFESETLEPIKPGWAITATIERLQLTKPVAYDITAKASTARCKPE